jgi:hypothetical protein
MTQLLEQAVARVKELSDEQQNTIAAIILQELEDDLKWEQAFANSQDQLAKWEEKVQADIRAGRVKKMGIDEL